MVEADRRKVKGEQARAKVLPHSVRIASVEGLEGLTFGRLAAEASVPKASIQGLFGAKEALQIATLDSAVELFRRNVSAPALKQGSPLQQLEALVRGWFDFVETRTLPGGCLITAVSSEFRTRPGPVRDRINEYRRHSRSLLRSLAQEATAAGEFSPGLDADKLAFDLLAYQAMANVAALMDDEDGFASARHYSLQAIARARQTD